VNSALETNTIILVLSSIAALEDVVKKVESTLKGSDDAGKPNFLVQKLVELKKLPPSQQIAVSGLTGFGSGYVVGKFGQIVVISSLTTGAVLYVSPFSLHHINRSFNQSQSFHSLSLSLSFPLFSTRIKRITLPSIGAL
jgi:hypothetical protein